MKNLKLALRSLLKTPLVTVVAIVSLALGVGANAAMFSIFEQMILRSLPISEPDRLVNLVDPGPKPGSRSVGNAGELDAVFSYPMLRDLQDRQTTFTGIAGHRRFDANLAFGGETVNEDGLLVSGSYFEVLRLRPTLGRLFSPEDDVTPGGHPLAVLAHRYWQNRFNGDPGILGAALTVNGRPLTVIGVAPPGFKSTTLGEEPSLFVPLSMQAEMMPGWNVHANRRAYWVYLFARLKDGASVEQAEASLNGIYSGIIQNVELDLQPADDTEMLQRFADKRLFLEPGNRGQSQLIADSRPPLLLLLGVTGFVLLIACANIANLLLVKAAHRSGEIAVRMSLGARRFQIVRQLLSESFLLAVAGSLLGIVVAQGTMAGLSRLFDSGDGGMGFSADLGGTAWIFLAVLTAVTTLVGLFPALHSTREDLVTLIKAQGGKASASRGANRFRAALVTLQIALSMALLTSAGLFIRSLVNVSRVDLGIQVEQLTTFGLSPQLNGYEPTESRALFQRLEEEIATLPGISGVVGSMVPLVSGSNWGTNVTVQGFESNPGDDTNSRYNAVGPGFFETMGIPILQGESFTDRHVVGTPKVAIVNETFAKKFGLGTDVVGKRMQMGAGGELDMEIIGLARDSTYAGVKQETPPVFYSPYRQDEEIGAINFYVRSPLPTDQLMPALRRAVAAADPNLPMESLQTMETQVRDNVFIDRVLSILSAAFAVLATLLAAVGLYGIMSYSVTRRTREIGLRMALGADARRVRRLILRQVGSLTVVGAVLGIFAALGIGRAAQALLYDLEGHDPVVFTLSVLALAAIVLASGLLPAHRASRVDPMEALAEE